MKRPAHLSQAPPAQQRCDDVSERQHEKHPPQRVDAVGGAGVVHTLTAQLLRATRNHDVLVVGDSDVDDIVTRHMHLDRVGYVSSAAFVFVTETGNAYGIYDPTHVTHGTCTRWYPRTYPYRGNDAFFFVVKHDGGRSVLRTYRFLHREEIRIDHCIVLPIPNESTLEVHKTGTWSGAWDVFEDGDYFVDWRVYLRPDRKALPEHVKPWSPRHPRHIDPRALAGVKPTDIAGLYDLIAERVERVLFLRLF